MVASSAAFRHRENSTTFSPSSYSHVQRLAVQASGISLFLSLLQHPTHDFCVTSMPEKLCPECVENQILTALKPPLDRTRVLASWSRKQLFKRARACSICNFVVEIIGKDTTLAHNIFMMANGEPFVNTYHLTLYWQVSDDIQCSVSIYPISPSPRIPSAYIEKPGLKVNRKINLGSLRNWMSSCGFVPSPSNRNVSQAFFPPTLPMIRLVDTHNRCLIDADLTFNYACLSYVWGQSAFTKLEKINLEKYKCKMGIGKGRRIDAQTVEDAISLVNQLGLQYLWVDSLCIVQNDKDDVSHFISQMGRIYSCAAVTIVSDSPDAITGIPGISVARSKPSPTLEAYGYHLVAMQLTLSEALRTSTWFRRGWTLQEMFFSKCILFFSDVQVFFQLDGQLFTEDGRRESTDAIQDSGQGLALVTLDYLQAFVPPPQLPALDMLSIRQDPQRFSRESLEVVRERHRSLYMELVRIYASRDLTYADDVLNAFEGVLEFFRNDLGAHIWGLPYHVFDQAMFWQVNQPCRRRQGFPSWSWSGWHYSSNSRLTFLQPRPERFNTLESRWSPLQPGSRWPHSPSSHSATQSAKYYRASAHHGGGVRCPGLVHLPYFESTGEGGGNGEGGENQRTTSSSLPSYTLAVLANYRRLRIQKGLGTAKDPFHFEVIEPNTQKKAGHIFLEVKWAELSEQGKGYLTFLELSRGRPSPHFMNFREQRTPIFSTGRPKSSGKGLNLKVPNVVIAMAVEKHSDGLWERVQLCEMNQEVWDSSTLPACEQGFFMIK